MADVENGDEAILTDESNLLLSHDGSGDTTNITEDSGVEDPVSICTSKY